MYDQDFVKIAAAEGVESAKTGKSISANPYRECSDEYKGWREAFVDELCKEHNAPQQAMKER